MIEIENVLISDEIIKEYFTCNLHQCKGACCEDGDAGAPLMVEELEMIIANYDIVSEYMTETGKRTVSKTGKYEYNSKFGWVTPTVNNAICAFGKKRADGVIECAFEQAYLAGKTKWKKPISCHLFPARIVQSKNGNRLFLNYEPREDVCQPACVLGKKNKQPLYIFLKEALLRKFGPDFYEILVKVAQIKR